MMEAARKHEYLDWIQLCHATRASYGLQSVASFIVVLLFKVSARRDLVASRLQALTLKVLSTSVSAELKTQ